MRLQARGRFGSQKGHAVVEVALLSPWIFFLFAGALDVGSYMEALIATQNAARVAAEYTSSHSSYAGDNSGACTYALGEMNTLPNVHGLTSCNALPLKVTASSVTGADGATASSVSVTYQGQVLIPIPLLGRMTVTRTVQMRMRDS